MALEKWIDSGLLIKDIAHQKLQFLKYGGNIPGVLHHSNKFSFFLTILENKIEEEIEKEKLNSGPQKEEGDQKRKKSI